MKAGARHFRLMALGLAIVALCILSWLGIRNVLADETTGLDYVGVPSPSTGPSPMPGQTDAEFWAAAHVENLPVFGEPPINQIVKNSDAEAYRFYYEPSFHPNVCVTIWRDADRYWLRTSVLRWNEALYAPQLWHKTQPLSAKKWNRLQSLFLKRSVTDPLNGAKPYSGLDGSSWYLESFVSGQIHLTEVSNPVRSRGFPHFQIVKSRDPSLDDFVSTSRLFLDWAGVRVPVMY